MGGFARWRLRRQAFRRVQMGGLFVGMGGWVDLWNGFRRVQMGERERERERYAQREREREIVY